MFRKLVRRGIVSFVLTWDGCFGYVGKDGQLDGMVRELVRRVSIVISNVIFYNV